MPLVCFSMLSGYSGQTTYDIYLLQVYNVFFTCFPIIVFAVFDWELPKKELVRRPKMYAESLRASFLTWTKYFWAIFEAMLHGFAIFLIGFLYFDQALTPNGMTSDVRTDGNLIYASVVIAVTFKILFDSFVINFLVLFSATMSIVAYFLFVFVLSEFPKLDIFAQQEEMFEFKQRVLVIFFITFAALPFTTLCKAFARLDKESEEESREAEEELALDERREIAERLLLSAAEQQKPFQRKCKLLLKISSVSFSL